MRYKVGGIIQIDLSIKKWNLPVLLVVFLHIGCTSKVVGDFLQKSPAKVVANAGVRPLFLINELNNSKFKRSLKACKNNRFYRTGFSIGHRGAAMLFPEHTKESSQTAIDSGAGIVPSEYAKAAKSVGLSVIAWSLERSGLLANGEGWYYKSITKAIKNDADVLVLLDVLAKDVGVVGVFSYWPATINTERPLI